MDQMEQFQIYTCKLCGQIVEIIRPGSPSLICCGQPMTHMREGASDGAKEKHVPVVEATAGGCKVKVGSVAHPMQAEHFIEWIELICVKGNSFMKFLHPGDAPEVEFTVPLSSVATVRGYCNLHGLWKA